MSDEKKTPKKIKIKESELVNLIDKLVNESLTEAKKEWLAEQATSKESLVENKIAELEAKINKLSSKK